MKVALLYRDASNYKWNVTAEIERKLKIEDEITMEELGYAPQTFLPEFTGFSYDADVDHNLLEVVEILPDGYEVQITLPAMALN